MIYLKSFNESKEDLILDELRDLIEGRLVHLLYDSEGFEYFIHKINTTTAFPLFEIVIYNKSNFFLLKYEEELLSLLDHLNRNYAVFTHLGSQIEIKDKYGYLYNYTIEEMLEDKDGYYDDKDIFKEREIKSLSIMKISYLQPKTFESKSYNRPRNGMKKRWSVKYKKSINCSNPKGFSQRQYCKRRKLGRYKS